MYILFCVAKNWYPAFNKVFIVYWDPAGQTQTITFINRSSMWDCCINSATSNIQRNVLAAEWVLPSLRRSALHAKEVAVCPLARHLIIFWRTHCLHKQVNRYLLPIHQWEEQNTVTHSNATLGGETRKRATLSHVMLLFLSWGGCLVLHVVCLGWGGGGCGLEE